MLINLKSSLGRDLRIALFEGNVYILYLMETERKWGRVFILDRLFSEEERGARHKQRISIQLSALSFLHEL